MNAQSNGIGVNLNKHNMVEMISLVVLDTILKSVLSETVDEISRQ
jgi:hypothetical protein